MPNVTNIILWQPLSFDEFSLWHPRVFSDRLHYCNAVILKVIIDNYWPNSIEFLWRFMNSLFEVGIKSEYLQYEEIH